MLTLRPDPTRLLPLFTVALLACGGGGEAPPAPTEGTPAEAPAPEAPSYPPIECPEGATYEEGQSSIGFEQRCMLDGMKHGPFVVWHTPELKAIDGAYEKGLTHDNWVWWYANGNKKSKGSYQMKKQTGSWTYWHENGNMSEEGDYLAGRKAGTWARYYESGKKRDEGLFHNGLKNGQWEYYRDDGENTLKRRERWQSGSLTETKYFDALGKKEIDEPLPEDVDGTEAEPPSKK